MRLGPGGRGLASVAGRPSLPVRASTSSCPRRASSYRFATPVQRAYSQYKHWVQVSAYGGDFEQFLADDPGAVEEGRYFVLLSRYLDLFRPRSFTS